MVKENIHRVVFNPTWTFNEINYFDLLPLVWIGIYPLRAPKRYRQWARSRLACLRDSICMQTTRPSAPLEHQHPPLPISSVQLLSQPCHQRNKTGRQRPSPPLAWFKHASLFQGQGFRRPSRQPVWRSADWLAHSKKAVSDFTLFLVGREMLIFKEAVEFCFFIIPKTFQWVKKPSMKK